jgi:hypothetical protein
MAVINKPDMNYGIWAENGNVEIPSSEKVELGWIAEKPLNEQMNWVQNRQDAMLQYINQHGIVEWDNVTEYPINAFVAREGVVYKALSQNVDKDPTLNTAIWTVAFADFSIVDTITKITDEDGYVEHYVRKSAPVLNAVAKGVGYSGDDTDKGVKFDGNDNLYVTNGGDNRYDFNGTHTNDNDVIRKSDLQAILEDYTRYKVDDLYITLSPNNPTTTLGYGTWVLYGKGKALVGLSEDNDNNPTWTKFVNSQFGSYEHQLTEDEMARHNHSYGSYGGMNDNKGNVMPDEPWEEGGKGSGVTLSSGGDKPHNNVQPSVVVAIWRRVA